jgi:hypothetical protein
MANGSRPQKGAAAAIAANRAASPRRGGQKIALKTVRKNEVLVSAALNRASYV